MTKILNSSKQRSRQSNIGNIVMTSPHDLKYLLYYSNFMSLIDGKWTSTYKKHLWYSYFLICNLRSKSDIRLHIKLSSNVWYLKIRIFFSLHSMRASYLICLFVYFLRISPGYLWSTIILINHSGICKAIFKWLKLKTTDCCK